MADTRLDICGGRSRGAQRLLSLAVASWSFEAAAKHLAEFCGPKVSGNTIRNVCHAAAGEIADWRHTQVDAHQQFRQAEGEVEFETDGTSVNRYDGWREMRVGIFAKRQAAEPATPDQWADRPLAPPQARTAFAATRKGGSLYFAMVTLGGTFGHRPRHQRACGGRWGQVDLGRADRIVSPPRRRVGYLPCLGTCRGDRQGGGSCGRRLARKVALPLAGRRLVGHCW